MERIVVGFDGSASSWTALRWAGATAARRGDEVRIVQSWHDAFWGAGSVIDAWNDPDAERHRLERELGEARTAIAGEHPTVSFTSALVGSPPVPALLEDGADAAMTVVGSRGRGGFESLLLGSVSQKLVQRSNGTVVVVRGDVPPAGPVVVGVDEDAPSRAALAWGAAEATLRRCALHVVMAWSPLILEGRAGAAPYVYADGFEEAADALHRVVTTELGARPDVDLHFEVVNEYPAKALVDRSAEASLVVIGPWSRRLRDRLEVGSVAMQVLHHARCPVAIVREDPRS